MSDMPSKLFMAATQVSPPQPNRAINNGHGMGATTGDREPTMMSSSSSMSGVRRGIWSHSAGGAVDAHVDLTGGSEYAQGVQQNRGYARAGGRAPDQHGGRQRVGYDQPHRLYPPHHHYQYQHEDQYQHENQYQHRHRYHPTHQHHQQQQQNKQQHRSIADISTPCGIGGTSSKNGNNANSNRPRGKSATTSSSSSVGSTTIAGGRGGGGGPYNDDMIDDPLDAQVPNTRQRSPAHRSNPPPRRESRTNPAPSLYQNPTNAYASSGRSNTQQHPPVGKPVGRSSLHYVSEPHHQQMQAPSPPPPPTPPSHAAPASSSAGPRSLPAPQEVALTQAPLPRSRSNQQQQQRQQQQQKQKQSSTANPNATTPIMNEKTAKIGGSCRPSLPMEALPIPTGASEITHALEEEGRRQLGDDCGLRRYKIAVEANGVGACLRCPHKNCQLHRVTNHEPNWMARHLAMHTENAARKQQTQGYVAGTVAELLHEICMDVEVPPHRRKFERRKLASALFGEQNRGMGSHAGVLEAKVIGNVGDPSIRRCAYEVAFGKCEGVGPQNTIVCCDTCGTWSHVLCGGVALGGAWHAITAEKRVVGRQLHGSHERGDDPVMQEEHICRGCALSTVGAPGSDPHPGAPSVLEDLRGQRKQMLEFLQGDVASGCPHGVFDLNMRVEKDDDDAEDVIVDDDKHSNMNETRDKTTDTADVDMDKGQTRVVCTTTTTRDDKRKRQDEQQQQQQQQGEGGGVRGKGTSGTEGELQRQDAEGFDNNARGKSVSGVATASAGNNASVCDPNDNDRDGGDDDEEDSGNIECGEGASVTIVRARAARAAISARSARSADSPCDGDITAGTSTVTGFPRVARSPCGAQPRCNKFARPDSRFCSDACGVLNAEALLIKALVHTLGEREGRERGKRLKDGREARTHRQQVWKALKKAASPFVPELTEQQGNQLHAIFDRKWLLWKRLIEIGAYWEKVSGSENLLTITNAAAAAAAAAAHDSGPRDSETPRQNERPGPAGATTTADRRADRPGAPGGKLMARLPTHSRPTSSGGGSSSSNKNNTNSNTNRRRSGGSGKGGTVRLKGIGGESRAAAYGPRGESWAAAYGPNTVRAPGDIVDSEGDMDVDVGMDGDDSRAAAREGEGGGGTGAGKRSSVHGSRAKSGALTVTASSAAGAKAGAGTYAETGAGSDSEVIDIDELEEGDGGKRARRKDNARPAKRSRGEKGKERAEEGREPRQPPDMTRRRGVGELSCPYCGEETGPRVAKHLEECYRQVVAVRNARMDRATLRPIDPEVDGQAPVANGRDGGAYREAVGRQILARRVPYADLTQLPDPLKFQLHEDLDGWLDTPSRLDFLYKELVRQRNTALAGLQALDGEEAKLERKIRHEWIKDGLRPPARNPNFKLSPRPKPKPIAKK